MSKQAIITLITLSILFYSCTNSSSQPEQIPTQTIDAKSSVSPKAPQEVKQQHIGN